MNNSGDAAEQIVRMSLEGVQMAAKITGDGAERLAKILILALKDTSKSKGKASLSKLLKSNKPIKVFELKDKDLKKFCEAAKQYGVLYHVLKDKGANNGKCDIMVRAEDASKVNRNQSLHVANNNTVNDRASITKSIRRESWPMWTLFIVTGLATGPIEAHFIAMPLICDIFDLDIPFMVGYIVMGIVGILSGVFISHFAQEKYQSADKGWPWLLLFLCVPLLAFAATAVLTAAIALVVGILYIALFVVVLVIGGAIAAACCGGG